MPIVVYCQECAKQYLARDEQAGQPVRCPAGHIMDVPAATAQSAAPDPSAVAPGANPYTSPAFGGARPGFGPTQPAFASRPTGKVWAPAIALLVVGSLGLLMSIFSVVTALAGQPPAVDPDLPPMFQEFAKGAHGPAAAIVQILFVGLNLCIIGGAVQMIRFKTWPFGLTASILAMINFGSCCCLLGVPVGIWSLVILLQGDVKATFAQQARV